MLNIWQRIAKKFGARYALATKMSVLGSSAHSAKWCSEIIRVHCVVRNVLFTKDGNEVYSVVWSHEQDLTGKRYKSFYVIEAML